MTINSISKISARATKSAIAGSVLTGGNFMQGFSYILEDYDSFSLNGQKVTLSFWFNATVAGTYSIAIRNSANTNCLVTTFTVSASTPTKIFKTFTVPSTFTTSTPTGASGLEINIGSYAGTAGTYAISTLDSFASGNFIASTTTTNWLANATADFIEIAQVQLEQGDTATDFESRPYQVELAMCQRYYEQALVADSSGGGIYGVCKIIVAMTTAALPGLQWRVQKRVTPTTVILYSRNNTANAVSSVNTGGDITGVTMSNISAFGCQTIGSSPAGFATGLAYEVYYTCNADF